MPDDLPPFLNQSSGFANLILYLHQWLNQSYNHPALSTVYLKLKKLRRQNCGNLPYQGFVDHWFEVIVLPNALCPNFLHVNLEIPLRLIVSSTVLGCSATLLQIASNLILRNHQHHGATSCDEPNDLGQRPYQHPQTKAHLLLSWQ